MHERRDGGALIGKAPATMFRLAIRMAPWWALARATLASPLRSMGGW